MSKCDVIEDSMQDVLSAITQQAFQVFNATSNQMIVAGMGAILGVSHQAIHEYMRTQYDFTKLEYRIVFNRVLSIDRIAGQMREKHKPPEKTSPPTGRK